ncbi:mediator of RNA polymerase II transcription subunit 20-like [Ruditapes philippinarum]|uniref:mediator of RNA polymerase II transcription subunit 20-like n=1 Tax=Ruditapes philippinarum TaxID=129788 RepID=UPI00295BF829|nr:mediator of RNA polymerase II transcription subunit 20-like [Ruditapes philippinarum]
MGVVCVYAYPIPEGKSGQQVVDSLQKDIELLGAVKTGSFNVDCETYNSVNLPGSTQQRLIHVLHNSEQPASCFSVLDTGTTLIADVLFEVLIAKLTQVKAGKEPLYQHRKGFKMESKGPRYELSDFIIKIGSVSMASNFKGILVEVEYCPCSVPNECWNLMRELMQSFLGNVAETLPVLVKNKMDTFYTAGDTINQYLEHFNNFRKQTNVNQQIR